MGRLTLVLGPARSGKSDWAEHLAQRTGLAVTYVATALENPADLEWTARIDKHRARRPTEWTTLAAPEELAAALRTNDVSQRCLLVDSLGTWVSNGLARAEADWAERTAAFLAVLVALRGECICVAEDVGAGVIPAYPSGRLFRDRLGHLVRQVGAIARPVYWVNGGHALNLSELGIPLPVAAGTLR